MSNWPGYLVYSASRNPIFPVSVFPRLIYVTWPIRDPDVLILLLSVSPTLLHYTHLLDVLYTNLLSFPGLFLLGISRDTSKIGSWFAIPFTHDHLAQAYSSTYFPRSKLNMLFYTHLLSLHLAPVLDNTVNSEAAELSKLETKLIQDWGTFHFCQSHTIAIRIKYDDVRVLCKPGVVLIT